MLIFSSDYFSYLLRQPFDPVLQAFPGDGVAGTDVPRFVHNLVEAETGRDLNATQRIPTVHFVGEKEHRQPPTGHVRMLQQQVEFVLHDDKPQPIAAVHHEYDAVAILVVVFPQFPIPAVAGHIERSEGQALIFN